MLSKVGHGSFGMGDSCSLRFLYTSNKKNNLKISDGKYAKNLNNNKVKLVCPES